MLLRTMTTPGRAALGAPIKVSCNTCHQVDAGGADHTMDPPGNVVSFGGGAYDVNGQQTLNSAYANIIYWNGRNDSLWSQIVAVVESHVSVNGSRLRVAWWIASRKKIPTARRAGWGWFASRTRATAACPWPSTTGS